MVSEPAADPDATPGTLRIRVKPWAEITVDGSGNGSTPKTLVLPPGRHEVVLANPGLEKREKLTITIRSGRESEIHRDWR